MSLPLPNFYILGAEKCGTTALYKFLDSHPDICMSRPKEPVYYECRYQHGAEYYSQSYFGHYSGEPLVGEARHRNFYLPYVAERILNTTPEASFIILLRKPDERAYSAWLNRVIRGYETLDFPDAILADMCRINSGNIFAGPDGPAIWCSGQDSIPNTNGLMLTSRAYRTYVDVGYYNIHLRRFFDLFPQGAFFDTRLGCS
ncbi:MAG: hypothetical protein U5P41_09365 [Gammaproteobacteria bacterium]|nr:hypothetical protein [Gammaproteobacteria bacterium]